MTRLTTVLKPLLLFVFFLQIYLLQSQVETAISSDEFLIHFEENVEESYIDSIREAYNSVEVWKTPLSDIRLWRVSGFPFTPEGSSTPIMDINGVVPPVKTKSGVDGVDFNLTLLVDPLSGQLNYGNDFSFPCSSEYSMFIPSDENLVKVSIFDTGYTPQYLDVDYILPQLISSGYDYVDDDSDYTDLNGHGTHITGIISHVSQYESGLNEKIEFDIRRTHDQNGQGELSNVIFAIDDAILAGVNIINMSFSYVGNSNNDSKIFKHAIATANLHDILIVASAGNNSVNNDSPENAAFPASFDNNNIISVASSDCEFGLSPFSNYGFNSVDIAAPGEFIPGPSLDGDLTYKSGTSQAAAIISGLSVALATHSEDFNLKRIKCSIVTNAETDQKLAKSIQSGGVLDAIGSLDNLESSTCDLSESRSNEKTDLISSNSIFPNPFLTDFTISSDFIIEKVNIFSSTGILVRSLKASSNTELISDVNDLAPGSYFIQISSESKSKTLKAIKY